VEAVVDVVKVCGGCERNVMNLPDEVQDAVMDLGPMMHLDFQIACCTGCPLGGE
jgi:hypothetical protein